MGHLPVNNRRHAAGPPPAAERSFFGRTTVQRKKEGAFFQAKLTVNQPGDAYEQEADAVATQVVRQPQQTKSVQRKKISGIQRLATAKTDETAGTDEERMRRDKEIQRKPDKEREDEEKTTAAAVQRKSNEGGGVASASVSSRIEQNAGRGSELPGGTKSHMQQTMGADFSEVRVHADTESAALNKELGAKAFTHGRDIYFNSGQYEPDTNEGRHLLAHELTHVVQQNSAPAIHTS